MTTQPEHVQQTVDWFRLQGFQVSHKEAPPLCSTYGLSHPTFGLRFRVVFSTAHILASNDNWLYMLPDAYRNSPAMEVQEFCGNPSGRTAWGKTENDEWRLLCPSPTGRHRLGVILPYSIVLTTSFTTGFRLWFVDGQGDKLTIFGSENGLCWYVTPQGAFSAGEPGDEPLHPCRDSQAIAVWGAFKNNEVTARMLLEKLVDLYPNLYPFLENK